MLNKILNKLFGVFDFLKDFLFTWGIKILIVLFACMVLHNVLKMGEITSRYAGNYKKLVPVYQEENKFMNVYVTGQGAKTVVILAGFGSQSPIVQYKTLTEGLKDNYRVVVVEYFGYGYSMSIKKPRTNDNIVEEIKKTLELAGVSGPYILMPHSLSNVYAMKFQSKYPELVQGIVSIDGTYPAEIKDEYRQEQVKATVSNVNITSIFELTGFERLLSYLKGDVFYIDKMKVLNNVYSKEDISVYRNRIGSSYLTRTMVNEIKNAEENMKEMQDYKYPEYLSVLEILSKDTVKEYDEAKNSGKSNVNLTELAEDVITNPVIQTVKQVEGDHMLQLSSPEELLKEIKAFLATCI